MDMEKLLMEMESCMKYHEERDNTFTVSVLENARDKLKEYHDLEEQGRLIVLSVKDIHPCRNCGTGWGLLSSDGTSKSCHDTCERLKEYNEKYNK